MLQTSSKQLPQSWLEFTSESGIRIKNHVIWIAMQAEQSVLEELCNTLCIETNVRRKSGSRPFQVGVSNDAGNEALSLSSVA